MWVAWSATGSDRTTDKSLTLPGQLVKVEQMPTTDQPAATPAVEQAADRSVQLKLTESPTYLWLKR
ncbi:MAG TPA: hypothetical protein VGN72_11530 [Tepidisphaeraceae bacterium]|nr:hypothetical protein [Tepidisphaeraceae bacterium]